MEVSHSVEKANQSHTHHRITTSAKKLRPYTYTLLNYTSSAKLEMKLDSANNFINTMFCTYDYFKMWDKRQLNPTYTCRTALLDKSHSL